MLRADAEEWTAKDTRHPVELELKELIKPVRDGEPPFRAIMLCYAAALACMVCVAWSMVRAAGL